MTLVIATLLLSACGSGDDENPFLRPYIRTPDMGALDMDQAPDLQRIDPFAPGRTPCDREGTSCELPGATGVCIQRTCRLVACVEGQGDCDDDPNNGCEIDLTRPESCGSCVAKCNDSQSCQQGRFGYTCAVGVLCPDARFDLDDLDANACEWTQRIEPGVSPQPEGRLAIVQRVALVPDDDEGRAWRGFITGFDADGARAILAAEQRSSTPQRISHPDGEPFSGESLALDARLDSDTLRGFDVWGDAAYHYEYGPDDEVQVHAYALQCAPRELDGIPTTQRLRTGALRTGEHAAELVSEHMVVPLQWCELPQVGLDPPTRELCAHAPRAFGPVDYLRWYYPYGEDATLENPGAHAPAIARLSEEEVTRCTQCVLDVTTGSFLAPRACFDETHCEVGAGDPLDCAQTCATAASACPDFSISDVLKSPVSARHYVVTARGVVVLRDDGQVWVPIARIEEPWSSGVVSGARFLRAAVARNGDSERIFLLHNQGFVRVVDVSLGDPVTIKPAHPDILISLGDVDERGAMAFLASDAQTLFFSDAYEGRLIRLNGLDHKREALTFEQDVPGNGFFGATSRGNDVVVFRMRFGALSAVLLEQ